MKSYMHIKSLLLMKQNDLDIFKQNAGKAAELLKKMSHPDRLLVLCYLSDGELSAGELAKKSNLSLSAFSQHLAILREAKLIKTRRVMQMRYYSIYNESVLQILATLKDIFCPESDI